MEQLGKSEGKHWVKIKIITIIIIIFHFLMSQFFQRTYKSHYSSQQSFLEKQPQLLPQE